MSDYAKKLIADYNQSLSFYLSTMYNQFDFHSNTSYKVKAVISSQFGAAVMIYPSNEWNFDCSTSDLPIEEAVLGKDNSKYWTQYIFSEGEGYWINFHPGMTHVEIADIGFKLAATNCTLLFNNVYINNVWYYFLILKSDNTKSSWDINAAFKDAKYIFEGDLEAALKNSESVREHYAQPDLDAKIVAILSKMNNQLLINGSIVYPPDEEAYELNQLQEYAKTKYGITNDAFVNQSAAALENISFPPPKEPRVVLGVIDSENWVYSTICAFYPFVLYAFFLFCEKVKDRLHDKGIIFLTSTVTLEIVLGAIGLEQLITIIPNDPPLSILQVILVVVGWILTCLGGLFLERKLRSSRGAIVNTSNST